MTFFCKVLLNKTKSPPHYIRKASCYKCLQVFYLSLCTIVRSLNFAGCPVQSKGGGFVVYAAVVDIKPKVHTAAVGHDIRVPIQISHGYGSSGLRVTAAP